MTTIVTDADLDQAAVILDRWATAIGRPLDHMRIGRLACLTPAGQALIAEATRRGVTVELIGQELS